MRQLSFADVELSNCEKTSRERFLDSMDGIVPWQRWVALIKPHYPSGERGRTPRGIETMLRMYLLQSWFNLSDRGAEDQIKDSIAFRKFMKIDFMTERVPDSTTLLHFRHILEEHKIGEKIFADVRCRLEDAGLMMRGGTVVDATIIEAPSSTKNATGKRLHKMDF